jgi:hypothetical protein
MDTNINIGNITKPCDCTFCSQFYVARLQKYRYNKYLEKNKNNKLEEKHNKTIDKNFTLSNLETITHLKSLDYDAGEISKQTNISYSIVDYVIKIITYKK